VISAICDVCGKPALRTIEYYVHRPGFRNMFGLHQLRVEGKMIDLCDEHWPVSTEIPETMEQLIKNWKKEAGVE
jgi:hypothetical protein